jgi:hypothetical protein
LVSLLTLIVIELDWHTHQKYNHETAQLSMTCQRGLKAAKFCEGDVACILEKNKQTRSHDREVSGT